MHDAYGAHRPPEDEGARAGPREDARSTEPICHGSISTADGRTVKYACSSVSQFTSTAVIFLP
ncbi:hypothetical protein M885DRAFT_81683 [Pelagophyceae sp. CCMP2097]|nr:hypothetical protein M885DRAFT_81683 [Pelagophyceae sp. CCMP2097]